MKLKKFKKLLQLNKQTITNLNKIDQVYVKGGARAALVWSLPKPTQCVPAHDTECGLYCEPTDYTCNTQCGQDSCAAMTVCQFTCDDLITG